MEEQISRDRSVLKCFVYDALSYSLSIFNFEVAAIFYIVGDVEILNQR